MDGHDDLFESRTGAVRVARFGAVFAGIYRAPLIAEASEELRVWQGPVMPDEPIAQFSLAFGVHRLAPEVQAAADRVLTAYGPRTCVSATVLVASGFQASAARAMLSTLYLLTRVAYPRRVFASVAEAESWLSSLGKYRKSIAASARWLTVAEAAESAAGVAARR